MVKNGLFVRLHAKPGKEAELAKLLEGGLSIVQEEGETPLWFAVKFDAKTFAIFDAFNDEAGPPGRRAHGQGLGALGPAAQHREARHHRLEGQSLTRA